MYQLFILQGTLRRWFKQSSTSYCRWRWVRGPWHSVCPRRFGRTSSECQPVSPRGAWHLPRIRVSHHGEMGRGGVLPTV